MPEENSAAEEHAIIQEVTAPLSTLPDNAVPAVADVEFPMALRGYDRLAVDAYVKRTSQLVAELQSTRSPEAAVRRALERVGEEVSGILQRAHEAAAQITTQSRGEAEDRLERARLEADEITSGARKRIKELDSEADRIWAERQRIVEDTQDLARQLLSLTDAAAQRFPAEEEAGAPEPPNRPLVAPRDVAALNGEENEYEDDPWPVRADGDSFAEANGDTFDTFEEPDTDSFEEDQTAIMPPIRPDEDQDS
jgi:cell division septum initiation protein DivIVA